MDEPLSNLDAKLRVEMRRVIKDIQKEVGITTVYVTHDQEEAMAISDRIAVMNLGVIQQIGSPRDLYQRPANLFVSTFIGRTNVLKGHLSGNCVTCEGYEIKMDNVISTESQDVQVAVRPEEFIIEENLEADGISGVVTDKVFLGLNTQYFVKLPSHEIVEILRESIVGEDLETGQSIKLRVKKEKINIFSSSPDAISLIKRT